MCDTGSNTVNSALDVGTGGATYYIRSQQAAASAQANAAMAQEAEQRKRLEEAKKAADPSPAELQALEESVRVNELEINRKQRLLDSADPALIEAGKQALELLQGHEANTMAPLRNTIAKNEAALREKLRAQLGTGYENTTAGIQALSQFRQAADDSLATAQQTSLNSLLSVAQNTSAGNGLSTNVAASQSLAGLYGNIQGRKVNAITGNPVTAAGSQYAGDITRAQTLNGILNTGMGIAGIAAGAGGGGGGGGASPTSGTAGYGGGTGSYAVPGL